MQLYPILKENRTIGTVKAEKDGLYWTIHADCEEQDGVWRLFAVNGSERSNLGVLQPFEGGMRLERRISCRSLRLDDSTRLTLTPQDMEAEGLRFDPNAPFFDLPRFCLYRVEDVGGRLVWKK